MSKTSQMPCKKCGYAYTKTNNTNRARTPGDVRRQRTCLKCGVGFVTYEVSSEDHLMLQALKTWSKNIELPGRVTDGEVCDVSVVNTCTVTT